MVYNGTKNSSGFQGNIESGFSPELNGDIPGSVVLGVQGPKGDQGPPGPRGLPGPQGEPFTFADFTPEQLESLRGPKGEPFTYEDFTPEQLENLKGESGAPGKDGTVSFDELTDAQKESLKGDPFTYEDFTAEQLAALKGEQGEPGYTPQKGTDYVDGKDGRTPQIELLNVVEEDNFGNVQNGVTIKANNFKDDGTESFMIATVWDGKDGADGQPGKDGADGYTPVKGVDYFDGQPGDDYVLTPADKIEIAEMAAELVEVPESSGGGIAVTGATVGQTVKISAVDENGVPTAWEPTDFPSGGGAEEVFEEITKVTLEEDVNGLIISEDVNGQPFQLKKVTIHMCLRGNTSGANGWINMIAGGARMTSFPNGFALKEDQDDYYNILVDVEVTEVETRIVGYRSDNANSTKIQLRSAMWPASSLVSRSGTDKFIDKINFLCNGACLGANTEIFVFGVRA